MFPKSLAIHRSLRFPPFFSGGTKNIRNRYNASRTIAVLTAIAKPNGLIGLKLSGSRKSTNATGPTQLPVMPMTRLPKNPGELALGKNIFATNPTTAPNPTQTKIKLTHAWAVADSSIVSCCPLNLRLPKSTVENCVPTPVNSPLHSGREIPCRAENTAEHC